MPVYDYRCPREHTAELYFSFEEWPHPQVYCDDCELPMARVMHANLIVAASDLAFQPHFNHSLGRVVHSRRDFENQRQEREEELGYELTYVDADEAANEVTDEGLDATRRHKTDDTGEREAKVYV